MRSRQRRVSLPPSVRSRIMARIRGRDTKAEVALRRALWALGARGYRLHAQGVVGTPDVSFRRQRVAVFVDGVFWHGHPVKYRRILSNHWRERIKRNRAHDRIVNWTLIGGGWAVLRMWDLDVLANPTEAAGRVVTVLSEKASIHRG